MPHVKCRRKIRRWRHAFILGIDDGSCSVWICFSILSWNVFAKLLIDFNSLCLQRHHWPDTVIPRCLSRFRFSMTSDPSSSLLRCFLLDSFKFGVVITDIMKQCLCWEAAHGTVRSVTILRRANAWTLSWARHVTGYKSFVHFPFPSSFRRIRTRPYVVLCTCCDMLLGLLDPD
jgi:hypothetical protein